MAYWKPLRIAPIAIRLVYTDIDLERRKIVLTGKRIQRDRQGFLLVHRGNRHPEGCHLLDGYRDITGTRRLVDVIAGINEMQRLRTFLNRLEFPETVAGGSHHAFRRIARVTVADTLHHVNLVLVDQLPPEACRRIGDELNLAGLPHLELHFVSLLVDGNQLFLCLATEKQTYNRAEIDDFLHCFGYFVQKYKFYS